MVAVENLITEHLDIWAAAVKHKSTAGRGSGGKIELYGIKKLRELILELAVRGLLVPQDPHDEPASELLKKIAAEKAKLLKEGKIKKEKPVPKLSTDQLSNNIPTGWIFTQLIKVALVDMGNSPPGDTYNDTGEGVPLINGPVEFSKGPFGKTIKSKFTTAPNVMCDLGDILVCVRGATTGRTNIAAFPACIGRGVARVKALAYQDYINLLMWENQSRLLSKGTGTTFPSISYVDLAGHFIQLPPLAEQHRIVAKVDELMALCDQLEQAQSSHLSAHETLVKTLLEALTQATVQEGFQAAWARIAAHFDTLFTTEWSIDQLKQTLLQLAVMGKLVPQDPNDEPASELLKKIAAEKAKLVKEGKIKKEKPLPPIGEDEKPFELPRGWEWVRLQQITSKITDGDHQTPPRISEGKKLLSAKNIRDGFLDFENCDFISDEHYIKSRERCLPETGDLLIVSVGGTIGRSSLVPSNSNFALVRSVALIKPLLINRYFLKCAMDSNLAQNIIHSRKRGGAQPCLYLSEISLISFTIPPLAEQHRIVAKVDELMALCDALKERLTAAQNTQLLVADVMAQHALR